MRSTWSIPLSPASPMADRATAVTMSVVNVIPEIGVTEIMAMAQAETEAKRKAMIRVRSVDMMAMDVARGSPASTEKRK